MEASLVTDAPKAKFQRQGLLFMQHMGFSLWRLLLLLSTGSALGARASAATARGLGRWGSWALESTGLNS